MVLISVFQIVTLLFLLLMGMHSRQTNYPGTVMYFTDGKGLAINFFQLLHFVYYAVFAMIFPDAWFFLWLTGLAWECMEVPVKWAVWSDIGYNTAGIAVGLLLRKIIDAIGRKQGSEESFIAVQDMKQLSLGEKVKRFGCAGAISACVIAVGALLSFGPFETPNSRLYKHNFERMMTERSNL